ncbi:hypothetical protein [Streptococcus sp. CSL10205-OR2]|uniref:hypothetical protein n=1 Tax=Streptococcus sp. CSL10205-OR2 TaxID=2980558 RepID=UPI0021D8EF95|nr:hypothetical protein [Streptococcus sp. CSL10205-OR2]MCU9533570.1 hypothetical protein [Streptococcus sp. CSL10205-OR2]
MNKKNNYIFSILFVFSFWLLIACSNQSETKNIATNDKTVEVNKKEKHADLGNDVQFMTDKRWQVDDEEGPFDLQLWHDSSYMGVLVYHLSDFNDDLNSAEKLLNFHIDDLKSKRNEFIEVEPLTVVDKQENIKISQVVYSGIKKDESTKFIYFFNMITFDDNPDLVAFVLMTTLPSDFEKEKQEFNDILLSAELLEP